MTNEREARRCRSREAKWPHLVGRYVHRSIHSPKRPLQPEVLTAIEALHIKILLTTPLCA